MNQKTRLEILLTVLLVGALFAAILLLPQPAGASPKRACYSAKLWSAADWLRPCARVELYEDGSGYLYHGTAARPVIRCTLPALDNLKRGRGFTIRCTAVAGVGR